MCREEKRVTTEKDVVEEAAILLTGATTKGVWNLTWIQSKSQKASFFQLGKNKQTNISSLEKKRKPLTFSLPPTVTVSQLHHFFIVKEQHI